MNSKLIALFVTTQMALHNARERATEEEGQTAVEWLGIAAIVIAVVVAVVGMNDAMGQAVRDAFTGLVEKVAGKAP